MKPTMRPYEHEDDFWRMRDFRRRAYLLNGRRVVGTRPRVRPTVP